MDNKKRTESLFYSIRCGLRGLGLVFAPGLRRYAVVPVLLNLVLFSAAFWLAGVYFEEFLNWLIPAWLDWLRWLLWPVFGLSFLLLTVFSFSLIANILGSFFYGKLAKKVELHFLDKKMLTTDVANEVGWFDGLSSEIKRLWYYFSRAVPILLLFVVPGVNLIAPFVWLIFSAWFIAMEFIAYPLEEDGFQFADQRQLMRPYRLNVIAFGSLVLVGLAIPFLNLLVPPAAVIGATIYAHNKKS